jgi:hypothetical protein
MSKKDQYYEKALEEIENENYIKTTYAKALRYSEGNDSKIKSLYIKYRVESLQKEANKEYEAKRIPSYAERNFIKISILFLCLFLVIAIIINN